MKLHPPPVAKDYSVWQDYQAVYSIFVMQGYMATGPLSSQELDNHEGQIGLADALACFANEIAVAVLGLYFEFPTLEHPGVLAYEVVEPLGRMLRTDPRMSDKNSRILLIASELQKFFHQPSTDPDVAYNHHVTDAQLIRAATYALQRYLA